MSKDRLTQDILDDYLLDAFTELRPHVELHHPECSKEMEQAYTQLKEIVEEHFENKKVIQVFKDSLKDATGSMRQQKPTVTREWVEQAWKETVNRFDLGYTSEFLFIKQLKEIGVEVVDED